MKLWPDLDEPEDWGYEDYSWPPDSYDNLPPEALVIPSKPEKEDKQ